MKNGYKKSLLTSIQKHWRASTCISIALIGLVIYNAWPDEKYVVTYKMDNKIEYKSLRNGTVRVLNFENHAHRPNFKRLQYYKYINPGDTLSGSYMKTGDMMPDAWTYNKRFAKPRVSRVNGRSLKDFIDVARRDSVLRIMHRYEQHEK